MIETPAKGLPLRAELPLTLPILCLACGRPATLAYRRGEVYRTVEWTCPHDGCHAVQSFELKGSVVEAVTRYEPPRR
jgi:hypothetical protein